MRFTREGREAMGPAARKRPPQGTDQRRVVSAHLRRRSLSADVHGARASAADGLRSSYLPTWHLSWHACANAGAWAPRRWTRPSVASSRRLPFPPPLVQGTSSTAPWAPQYVDRTSARPFEDPLPGADPSPPRFHACSRRRGPLYPQLAPCHVAVPPDPRRTPAGGRRSVVVPKYYVKIQFCRCRSLALLTAPLRTAVTRSTHRRHRASQPVSGEQSLEMTHRPHPITCGSRQLAPRARTSRRTRLTKVATANDTSARRGT
jgi:hypothetical protein